MTDEYGSADHDALTSVDYDAEPGDVESSGAMHRFGTRVAAVANQCSSDVLDAYWLAEAMFTQATLLWGNECFDGPCDRARLAELMLTGIEDAQAFRDVLERRGTQDEAAAATPPAGTLNIVGSLRLYDDIERDADGAGGQFCYGGDIYDLGYDYPVEVTDATGTKVALGSLDQGQIVNKLCVFNFVAEAVPDRAGVFSLNVGGFEADDFTIDSYRDEGNLGFQLTLGFDG